MLIAPFAFLLAWLFSLLAFGLLAGGVGLVWAWYVGAVVGTAYLVGGLVMIAVNLLGVSGSKEGPSSGEGTRERVDEAVEGELPGPLDTTRGESVGPDEAAGPRRKVGVGTSHLTTGTRPKEVGRR